MYMKVKIRQNESMVIKIKINMAVLLEECFERTSKKILFTYFGYWCFEYIDFSNLIKLSTSQMWLSKFYVKKKVQMN
jgi:hypothetical protein